MFEVNFYLYHSLQPKNLLPIKNNHRQKNQSIRKDLQTSQRLVINNASQDKSNDRIDVQNHSYFRRTDAGKCIKIQEKWNNCVHYCNDLDVKIEFEIGDKSTRIEWEKWQQN